ncbi:hypothetical protein EDC01DRAFT_756109 [Geopyxis carbonaria]|nr:hypothetical protein EDC01DRAFT_756109 [Geopyxis carbonaria]
MALGLIPYLYRPRLASSGLLLQKDGMKFLTTSAHLLDNHARGVNKGNLIRLLKSKLEARDLKVWAEGYEDGPIASVHKLYDEQVGRFPEGYGFDLVLLKPLKRLRVDGEVPELPQMPHDSLYFNQLLRLVTTDNPVPLLQPTGRAFGETYGITVGQAIMRSNEILKTEATIEEWKDRRRITSEKQLARSILWRTAGSFQSLQRWSGAAVAAVRDGATATVVGFQSWEWIKDAGDEDTARTRAAQRYWPFYGMYTLPEEIGGSRVVMHG